jgi:hypothetical protein
MTQSASGSAANSSATTCIGPHESNSRAVSGSTRRFCKLARTSADLPTLRRRYSPVSVRRFSSPWTVLRGASNRRARSVRLCSSSASSSSAARMPACSLDRKIGSNAGAALRITRSYLRSNRSVEPTLGELRFCFQASPVGSCAYIASELYSESQCGGRSR